jgi:hypothetical protein
LGDAVDRRGHHDAGEYHQLGQVRSHEEARRTVELAALLGRTL